MLRQSPESRNEKLTVHVDVLAQLNQLHLCGHVAHRPHEIAQVLTGDQPVLVFIELVECVAQLCGKAEPEDCAEECVRRLGGSTQRSVVCRWGEKKTENMRRI